MKLLGILLLLAGLGTFAAHFLDWHHSVVDWVSNWGENVAWGIRGGTTVLGLLLMMLGGGKGKTKKG